MAYQAVFKRYELKYLITQQQQARILKEMEPCMAPDSYGPTVIRNLYFDTESYRLIRHSIEKTAYKEKLRLRSYQRADSGSPVFVELKKKYDSLVYKRRIALPEDAAMQWLTRRRKPSDDTQITAEIEYVLDYYRDLRPVVFLSYERQAFFCRDDSDFRITFDREIRCRQEELTLQSEPWGSPILTDGMVLMELKCSGGIPLWMTELLSRERIYKTSYSKYGTAYKTLIFPAIKGGQQYA